MNVLEGKVALVTGGNSGIGLAAVKKFHENGAKIVFSGRDPETLAAVANDLGADVLGVQADVTRAGDLDKLMTSTHEAFGKLDVLFVNAGIVGGGKIEAATEEMFDRVVSTNFKGAYFTIQKALPFLNDGASIILNGSISAKMGSDSGSLYSASKAAVHSLARTLSTELLPRRIRVNTITIGPTETPIIERDGQLPEATVQQIKNTLAERIPIKRMGRPEEIANVALFLASDQSSFVVGSEIAAEGGILINAI
ncbi:oxidoreductase [Dictyobacter alpinus]|uniref:Oxidoreductase n=1 Tax=Dictyobacter alpinus TaxID=2014873 RepID=A0A402BDJ4_9CHLR|nr:SDR family oxidoreductase [Dictyobacter alpinus]GCE29386.1 oxidoreductase [Dictyobacter alpinus]